MEIVDLNDQENGRYRLSDNAEIALTRNTADFDVLFKSNLILKGCCLILIESGKSSFCVSGENCMVEEGELIYVNNEQSITDIMVSTNFRFMSFFLSIDFSEKMASRLNLAWKFRSDMMMSKYAKTTLNEAEIKTIQMYFELLDTKRNKTSHEMHEIDALCTAFGFYMLDVLSGHEMLCSQDNENVTCDYNVIEQHFGRFMHLLVDSPTIEHKVNVYAEKLCISPKYLNMICHKAVNQTPSAVINREISQRAIKLLQESSLSIKQIAQQLGFANQSHFGSFLRRETGKSPQQIRKD